MEGSVAAPGSTVAAGTKYAALGLRRVVNCMGAVTMLGGLPLSESVVEAMRAAAGTKVNLFELHLRAGERLAELTGTEAAYVTAGAAAGWQLGAAACLTGTDRNRIARLPEVVSERDEIVIHRKHRNNFDHALRNTGARLVQFGYSRDRTEEWELEAAIGERSAALAYVAGFSPEGAVLSLEQCVEIAHRHDIPVIVDAAVCLPPAANLKAVPATGADVCAFSGGKDLGGPQNTGFVAGRADLIEACRMNANPNHNTIGRVCKVNAEAIVGLVTAVEEYVARDPADDQRRWRSMLETIGARLDADGRLEWSIEVPGDHVKSIPTLKVVVPGGTAAAEAAVAALRQGDPEIWLNNEGDRLAVIPHAIFDDDVELVGERLAAIA